MVQIDNITWQADENKVFSRIEDNFIMGTLIQLGKIYQTDIDDSINRYEEVELTKDICNMLGIEYKEPTNESVEQGEMITDNLEVIYENQYSKEELKEEVIDIENTNEIVNE